MQYKRDEGLEELILEEMVQGYQDPTRQHPSVTDLIYCLTRAWYQQAGARHSRTTKMYFALGLGLEANLLVGRKTVLAAGEFEGVHYHIDSLDQSLMVELKTTRMAPNKFPEGMPVKWLQQILSYCKTQNTTKAKLVVLHIIQAELIAWDLEFTQEEVDRNWEWVQDRKKEWYFAEESGEAPKEFTFNEDWECRDCNYKVICDSREMLRRYEAGKNKDA